MMSWRVAFVPRPRSSIISISLPWPMRDGGCVSFASTHGFGRGRRPRSPPRRAAARRRRARRARSSWPSSTFGISSSLERAVGIDREEAGLDQHVAAHEVGLGAGLDVGARRLRHRRVGERREEAAHDQLVDLAVAVVGQHARVERLRRVDRRVVGGLLLAARRLELVALGERRRLLERVDLRDRSAAARAPAATSGRRCCPCADRR